MGVMWASSRQSQLMRDCLLPSIRLFLSIRQGEEEIQECGLTSEIFANLDSTNGSPEETNSEYLAQIASDSLALGNEIPNIMSALLNGIAGLRRRASSIIRLETSIPSTCTPLS